jgi:hypothetical protein
MFCPECRAEFRPGFTRCSDCNVPLVERLSVTHGHADREQVPRVAVLKEWGVIIVLPIMFLLLMILFAALRKNPFEIQIVSLVAYTGFVFLLVFCDTRSWKGYSLGEKVVRYIAFAEWRDGENALVGSVPVGVSNAGVDAVRIVINRGAAVRGRIIVEGKVAVAREMEVAIESRNPRQLGSCARSLDS